MSSRIVTTQTDLDVAIRDDIEDIEIRSERGVWLEIFSSGSATVRASDSATVQASGSATVQAFDSATVQAFDSATVQASGSATVRASGSATVQASGSATVRAFDSATVRASGSATVQAFDSATVQASDSATVQASDSATVQASDSATVQASDSATVQASSHTAVHLHSGRARIEGGVLIDHTNIDLTDPTTWCNYHGVIVAAGIATVYKAVGDGWTTNRGFDYSPGSLPACNDFEATDECGAGLHFGPTPGHALAYHSEATRFVACGVRLDELQPITGDTAKCKAPRVVSPCVEVDVHGRVLDGAR